MGSKTHRAQQASGFKEQKTSYLLSIVLLQYSGEKRTEK